MKRDQKAYQAAYYLKNRERLLAAAKAYAIENAAAVAVRQKRWRTENAEKVKLKKRADYLRDRQKIIQRSQRWSVGNPARRREHANAVMRRSVAKMSKAYIVGLLCDDGSFPRSGVTQPLIEAKRVHLKLRRLIKEKTK